LVLGTPAYFQRAGIPATPAELSRHAAVIYTRDRDGSDTWSFRRVALGQHVPDQHRSELSVSLSGPLRVSVAEGVRAAVLAGMGLAIASRWMFAPELASGAVHAVLEDCALPASDLWVVFPTGRMASAKARAFEAFVDAELHEPHSGWE
jgi:DNA-binding transcriptional LysR family regulator